MTLPVGIGGSLVYYVWATTALVLTAAFVATCGAAYWAAGRVRRGGSRVVTVIAAAAGIGVSLLVARLYMGTLGGPV
ncbi:MAG: hypothetical protein M3295_04970 [Chloroflexota bacterium]|nr:hypothetical protein [Chloroflexota bacterium]